MAHSHDPAERASTPPLLFFKRVTHKGKSKGFPGFQGFGVIRSVDLVTQWDNKKHRSFTNYAFDFTVFNLEAEHEEFDWSWVHSRRDPARSLVATNKLAPDSWQRWIRKGANYLDRARRRVSRLSVENSNEQKPAVGSEAEKVLLQIYDYYSDRKHQFEALAEVIAEKVIGAEQGNYEKGWIT